MDEMFALPQDLEEQIETYPLNKAAISRFVKTQRDSIINGIFSILNKKSGTQLIQENGVSYLVRGDIMSIYRGIGSSVDEFIHERVIKFDEPRKRLVEAKEEVEDSKIGLLDLMDEVYLDQIPGGKGDKAKPSDFNLKQVLQGILVELEHTKDEMKALEISLDHLSEDPEYYTKLKKVHKENSETDEYGLPVF